MQRTANYKRFDQAKIITPKPASVAVNQAEGFLQKAEKTTCGNEPVLIGFFTTSAGILSVEL